MDENIKKAVTLPWIATGAVLGLIGTVLTIADKFKTTQFKLIFTSLIFFTIIIGTMITLVALARKQKQTISDLEKNNKGLIETKEKYLDENLCLKKENDKFRNLMILILSSNDKSTENDELKKVMLHSILGGENDAKRYLEDNQNN